MKRIFVITDVENDDFRVRNELERVAIKLYGNLYGLKRDDNKKIIYMFNFVSEKNAGDFKQSEQVKRYNILEV
jgi:hypothetical protein